MSVVAAQSRRRRRGGPAPAGDAASTGGMARFALQLVSTALNFAIQTLAARTLGPTSFGAYAYTLNFAQLTASPSDLGYSVASSRLIPAYRAQGETAVVRALVTYSQVLTFTVGSLAAATVLAVTGVLGSGPVPWTLLGLGLVSAPLFALTLVQMNVARALGGMWSALLPSLVLQPAALLALIGWRLDDLTVAFVVGATAVTLAATALVQMVIVARLRSRFVPAPRSGGALRIREWTRVSLPILAINLLQLVFQRLDILFVGVLLDARAAGIYALASRIAAFTSLMASSYTNMIAPQLSHAHWSDDPGTVRALMRHTRRVTLLPAVALTLCFALGGGALLQLFGQGFQAGHAAMAVYALGQCVSVAFGPVGMLAVMIGQERLMLRRSAIAAGVALVGYLVLIPLIGILGAAVANAVGLVCRNEGARRLCRDTGYPVLAKVDPADDQSQKHPHDPGKG